MGGPFAGKYFAGCRLRVGPGVVKLHVPMASLHLDEASQSRSRDPQIHVPTHPPTPVLTRPFPAQFEWRPACCAHHRHRQVNVPCVLMLWEKTRTGKRDIRTQRSGPFVDEGFDYVDRRNGLLLGLDDSPSRHSIVCIYLLPLGPSSASGGWL